MSVEVGGEGIASALASLLTVPLDSVAWFDDELVDLKDVSVEASVECTDTDDTVVVSVTGGISTVLSPSTCFDKTLLSLENISEWLDGVEVKVFGSLSSIVVSSVVISSVVISDVELNFVDK